MSIFSKIFKENERGLHKFDDALFGTEAKLKKVDTMTSQQKKMIEKALGKVNFSDFNMGKNKLYQQGQSFLQNLMQPGALDNLYNQMEAPMMRQFQEEIVPSIAERFSGMGAQSSSAFKQSLSQAGAGLQERLAALKGQTMLQGTQQQLQGAQLGMQYAGMPASISQNLLNTGLGTNPFGHQNIPGQPGLMQGIAQALPALLAAMI